MNRALIRPSKININKEQYLPPKENGDTKKVCAEHKY